MMFSQELSPDSLKADTTDLIMQDSVSVDTTQKTESKEKLVPVNWEVKDRRQNKISVSLGVADSTAKWTTVISKNEFLLFPYEDLGDIVNYTAGLYLNDLGTIGYPLGISVRGSSPKGLLLLLDGRPMLSPADGFSDLNWIPIEFIERIEIWKGGLSSLYGSGALAGVINIVTKEHEGENPYTRFTYVESGLGHSDFDINYSQNITKKISTTIGSMRRKFDGPLDEPYEAWKIRGKFNWRLNRDWELEWLTLLNLNNTERSYIIPSLIGNTRTREERHLNNGLRIRKFFSDNNLFQVQGYVTNLKGQIKPKSITQNLFQKSSLKGINVQQSFQFGKGQALTGISLERKTVRDSVTNKNDYAFSRNEHLLAGYIQNQFQWKKNAIRISGRVEKYTDFSIQTAWNIDEKWDFSENTDVSMNAARSFRYPALSERFYSQDVFYKPNPGLIPELSHSISIGGKFKNKVLHHLELLLFYQQIKHPILAHADTLNVSIINSDDINISGIEVNGEWQLEKLFKIGGHYTFNHLMKGEHLWTPEHSVYVFASLKNVHLFIGKYIPIFQYWENLKTDMIMSGNFYNSRKEQQFFPFPISYPIFITLERNNNSTRSR